MRKLKLAITGIFLASLGVVFTPEPYLTVATGQAGPAGLSAPSGVSASDGDYSTKVGLTWNAVRGATVYRIFRNTTNDASTALAVGSTAAPFFFDPTAVVGQQYTYWVRAENGVEISEFSQGDTGRRASGTQQGPVPPLEPPPVPPANQITAAKATLGKVLFWEEQLSSTLTVSCGTCHKAASGGSDPRSIIGNTASRNPGFDGVFNSDDDVVASPGVPLNILAGNYNWSATYGLEPQVTSRKANSHLNAAYSPLLFWDGRATGTFRDPITNAIVLNVNGALESQAVGPPLSDSEMAHAGRNWTEAAAQIAVSRPLILSPSVPPALQEWIGGRTYPELFDEAFGTPEVTPSRIALAIGTYERTQFSDRTPLDLANAGISPLAPAEQRGRNLFVNIQCAVCHAGNLLSDNQFHFIGIRPQGEDPGRAAVTGNNNNLGQFRTPSLRNVELRGPLMHNGRFATLEDVVEFYNRGGDFPQAPNFPDNLIQPRNLTAPQKADLVAFLRRPLTDVRVASESGPFDRPALYTESDRVPLVFGEGTNGSGDHLPQVIAIEPPLAGNRNFTVAISNALGGANAVLVISDSDPGNIAVFPQSGSFARIAIELSGDGAGLGYGSVNLEMPDTALFIGKTFYGRWYVNDPGAPGGVAVSQGFRFSIFGIPGPKTPFDYDGDGRSDISVQRPAGKIWHLLRGTAGYLTMQYGLDGDRMVPADYDGDGKTDVAVFRPSTGVWFIYMSQSQTFQQFGWGQDGDIPVPTDRDADGKADLVIYRESNNTWYTRFANATFNQFQFGVAGDKPMLGDFDGDGIGDVALFRPSNNNWYLLKSSLGFFVQTWGQAGDIPLTGDFDGDGATDQAVFRPSTGQWFLSRTTAGFSSQNWGQNGDIPVAADYDGDGKTDVAVFRPSNGTWYIVNSTTGILVLPFGQDGDVPTQASYIN